MMRDITIKPALNGWTAKVGCQTLVYVDKQALLKDLDQYLADPDEKEKAFIENAVNKRLLDVPALASCATEPCVPPQGLGMPDAPSRR